MIYFCITPERETKTTMIMTALARGFRNEPHKVVVDVPPDDEATFVVWGQEWTALRAIPKAVEVRRPFWHIDNGFWNPARGTSRGYYRFTYRSMTPIVFPKEPRLDLQIPTVRLQPWRKDGRHVLLAMPGVHFGTALGIDVRSWCENIGSVVKDICASVDRPVVVRERNARRPLRDDLYNAWALVTHSSNVAVDAVIAGIPVFVQPTNSAAPVGKLDLDLENPITPGRDQWLRSLASQQFTLGEMQNGVAKKWMKRISEIVDGKPS